MLLDLLKVIPTNPLDLNRTDRVKPEIDESFEHLPLSY